MREERAGLRAGDVFRMPGDERPGRLWVVELVTFTGATVRPFTKRTVHYETARGDEVDYSAMDGSRTVIGSSSSVEVVDHVDVPPPRWLARSRRAQRKETTK